MECDVDPGSRSKLQSRAKRSYRLRDDLLSSETIGFAGVTLLLVAFLLNLLKILRADSAGYLALNLLGASLACLSSWLIAFMPFVLLEGIWAPVAAISLARLLINGRNANRERTA